MIFTSISARRLNRDPEPWVYADGSRHARAADPRMVDGELRFDTDTYQPRAEFTPVQHAETNPILDLSRDSWDDDWGDALAWGFAACSVLEYLGEPIPDEYGYRASMSGSAGDLADGSYESSEVVAALGLGEVTELDGEPVVTLYALEDVDNDTWIRAGEYATHAARVLHLIANSVPEEDRY